jgi:hypothetical protein
VTRARTLASIVTLLPALAAGCADEPPAGADRADEAGASAGSGARASPEPAAGDLVAARGPTRLLPPRPASRGARACSRRRAVCVHGGQGTGPAAARRALASAERALDGLIALRLPTPLPDFAAGGGPELDVYLEPGRARAEAIADLGHVDDRWDLAPAFVLAPPPAAGGCVEGAQLAEAVAAAGLLGLDAGVEPMMRDAVAGHLGALVAPCGVEESQAIDDLQRAPERGLHLDTDTRGGRLFLAWLEQRHGSGRPGELAAALVAAAPQQTPAGSAWFRNEPDVVDILQENARAGGSPPFGELLRDFGVARAFVGSRSDDAHLVDVARFGDLGRVRFEWSVPWSTLPRRLAPARPVQPTGASYVWVDLAGAPAGASLTIVAAWEPPVAFRWAVVKVGLEGDEVGRLEPPTQLGATSIQQSIVQIGGLAGLVVVGINEGGSSAIDHHDPDDGPFLGRSYTVTIHPE